MKALAFSPSLKSNWDSFVSESKNATFLLKRDFMEYHSDRFEDVSAMVYDDNGQLRAVFPANKRQDGSVATHSGLTYGGLVLPKGIKLEETLLIFQALLSYYKNLGVKSILYKSIPHFYHSEPAFEEQYAMFLLDAKMVRMDTGFVTEISQMPPFQSRRLRSVKKAEKLDVTVRQTSDLSPFWNEVLSPNLMERFGVKPVHSLDEIQRLQQFFPENILQFDAILDDKVVAGTTIFLTPLAAHAQYISASTEGRDSGALDFLFNHLITGTFKNLPYFSFGIANELEGRQMNRGLMEWKEGFGAKVFPNIFYEIDVNKHDQCLIF